MDSKLLRIENELMKGFLEARDTGNYLVRTGELYRDISSVRAPILIKETTMIHPNSGYTSELVINLPEGDHDSLYGPASAMQTTLFSVLLGILRRMGFGNVGTFQEFCWEVGLELPKPQMNLISEYLTILGLTPQPYPKHHIDVAENMFMKWESPYLTARAISAQLKVNILTAYSILAYVPSYVRSQADISSADANGTTCFSSVVSEILAGAHTHMVSIVSSNAYNRTARFRDPTYEVNVQSAATTYDEGQDGDDIRRARVSIDYMPHGVWVIRRYPSQPFIDEALFGGKYYLVWTEEDIDEYLARYRINTPFSVSKRQKLQLSIIDRTGEHTRVDFLSITDAQRAYLKAVRRVHAAKETTGRSDRQATEVRSLP